MKIWAAHQMVGQRGGQDTEEGRGALARGGRYIQWRGVHSRGGIWEGGGQVVGIRVQHRLQEGKKAHGFRFPIS